MIAYYLLVMWWPGASPATIEKFLVKDQCIEVRQEIINANHYLDGVCIGVNL